MLSDPEFSTICVQIANNDRHGAQLQVEHLMSLFTKLRQSNIQIYFAITCFFWHFERDCLMVGDLISVYLLFLSITHIFDTIVCIWNLLFVQVHPNLDKKEWQQKSVLKLKSVQKPFPVNMDVGILKWKYVTKDEEQLPLTSKYFQSASNKLRL